MIPLKAKSTTGRVWPEQVSGVCLIAMAAANRASGAGSEGRLVPFSQLQRLRLLKAPALTLGLDRETEIGGQPGGTEVRKGLGNGSGNLRPATDSRGGREREGGRKVGDGENHRIGGLDPHRPHRHRPEVTTSMTLSVRRK